MENIAPSPGSFPSCLARPVARFSGVVLDFRIARITWPLHERRELFVQDPHSALNLLLLVRAPVNGRSYP